MVKTKSLNFSCKICVLVVIVLIFNYTLLISDEIWTQFYDPFYEAIWKVEDVIVCSDGDYAINGSTIDYDTSIEWGFVIKTDSAGNLEWAEQDIVDFQPRNEARAFVETDDGGFLSSSYCWVNGTALIKRNSEGEEEWTDLIEGTAIESFDKTTDNNLIGAGRKIISETVWPNLIKMDQEGEELWEKNYIFEDYGFGNIAAVIQSQDGGYLLAGSLYLSNNSDLLIIKTNSAGDTLWTRILDETDEDDEARTIIETDEGDIFVGGYLEGITAGFLWKLDSQGNTIWFESGTQSCGYGFRSFDKFNDGKIISTFGDVEMDSSIRKFDSYYNIDWTNNLEFSFGHGDKTVRINNQDDILVGLLNPANCSAGLIKLDSSGNYADDEVSATNKVSLVNYPNPFYSKNSKRSNFGTTIKYTISTNSEVLLQIFNIKGQLIKTLDEGRKQKGVHLVEWKAENCSPAIYFTRLLINNSQNKILKITILK